MGERQAEVICGEGEGKRLRAKCADDQDQADRRCFDQVVEQLGPVKFRRLAGEWFAAQGTGDGESGIMARDGGKLHLEHDEAMRTYIPKLMQWSRAGLLTYHLTRKLPKHDRAAIEVEEDLRQHVVCAVACKRAKRAGVLTEERFLKDNLSSIMSKKSWKLVQEAREYWRPTIVVEVPGRKNIKVWVLLVYLCILSGSPEEVAAAENRMAQGCQTPDDNWCLTEQAHHQACTAAAASGDDVGVATCEWCPARRPAGPSEDTHEALGFTDQNLQKLFGEVVAVRQEWLAKKNKDRANVLAIHWQGSPASSGKLISDALNGLAAVNMHTVSDDGIQNWKANVFPGKHASRADTDVVDAGRNMRSRQFMYSSALVAEAVSRARELGRLACTEAAESSTDKITTTAWLKPRVITVTSGQIARETERCPTLSSANDKTTAASAIVQRLCPSGLTVRGLQAHTDGSVSVAVVLNSLFDAHRFTASLSELRSQHRVLAHGLGHGVHHRHRDRHDDRDWQLPVSGQSSCQCT